MGYLTALGIILSTATVFFVSSTKAVYQNTNTKAVDTANAIALGWTPQVQAKDSNSNTTSNAPFSPPGQNQLPIQPPWFNGGNSWFSGNPFSIFGF